MVLRDERFVKDVRHARPLDDLRLPWTPGALKPFAHTLLDADGDEHRRLRNLVRDAFAPAYVSQLEPRVRAIADQLLDRMAVSARPDLVADFALPLPLTVISEILGVPEHDRMRFRGGVQSMLGVTASSRLMLRMLLKLPSILAMIGCVRRLIADHRRYPRADLVSRLIGFQKDGDRLTDDELLAMVLVLLIAGDETTVNLISHWHAAAVAQSRSARAPAPGSRHDRSSGGGAAAVVDAGRRGHRALCARGRRDRRHPHSAWLAGARSTFVRPMPTSVASVRLPKRSTWSDRTITTSALARACTTVWAPL